MLRFISAALQISDTVIYLVNYAGYYRIDEIIYITGSFVFLIIELLLVHIISYCVFKKINYEEKCDENAD